jgi:UDP-3-O-[3-hydroxymyristoyl] N-acetylglucosamine deacetylase
MQHTVKSEIALTGIGLHSGSEVMMVLRPAEVDTGINFVRADVLDKNNRIPAKYNNVVDTRLCTVIGNQDGVTVGTIEHLMAALRGCGVDNVIVELDSPEVPVMDGSSAPFVELLDEVGLFVQNKPRRAIKVLKEVIVEDDGKFAALTPSKEYAFAGEINFDHPSIGNQTYQTKLLNGNFRHDIAQARTFGFLKDVEAMRRNGLALGGSLDNAIVLDDKGVMNANGLRFKDEFIRHKLLDAIGDLYLAGGPILGSYSADRPGHAINNALLHELFSSAQNYTFTDLFLDEPSELSDSEFTLSPDGRHASVVVA